MLKEVDLTQTLLLIFANKQDVTDALTTDKVAKKLGLSKIPDLKYHVEATVATSGVGLYEVCPRKYT